MTSGKPSSPRSEGGSSVWERLLRRLGISTLLRLMNAYPPFVGAGIRVRHEGPGRVVSTMRLGPTNRNMMGTHFGGSLYAMCDPFFVILLADALGPDFMVWDKAATIRFVRPGKGRVSATFFVGDDEVDRVRVAVATERKVEPVYRVDVVDETGAVVAEVEKTLYVRRKLPGVDAARRM